MGYKQIAVDKQGKKVYQITVELGKDILGKRVRHKENFHGSLSEVKLRYAELVSQYHNKEKKVNVRDLSFKQYSDIFLKKYCEGNIGLVTINNYKRLLKYIIPYLGDFKLSKITSYMLDNMYQKLKRGVKGKELSNNSMYDYYKIINVMFNQAVKWEFIDKNPNTKAQKPKKETKEQKFYDLEQVNKLINCLENESIRDRTLVILALDSGARRGEISALRWSDLDFNTGTLKIERSLKVVKGIVDEKKPKTSSSIRTIQLSNTSIKYLKDYKEWQDNYIISMGKKWQGQDRIFTSINGSHMHPSTCYKIFTKIIKKYGLEHISFHNLRHTSASLYVHKGVSLKAVSQKLGHSNVNITASIYTHTFNSDIEKSASIFDEVVKNA